MRDPAAEGAPVFINGFDVGAGRRGERTLSEDEAKDAVKVGVEDAALGAEDAGVGAAAVEAEDAWEVEVVVLHENPYFLICSSLYYFLLVQTPSCSILPVITVFFL